MNKQETPRKLWVVNYEERFQVSVTAEAAAEASTRTDVGSTDATAVVEPTAEAAAEASVGAAVGSAPAEPTVNNVADLPPLPPALLRLLSCTADDSVTPQVETPA